MSLWTWIADRLLIWRQTQREVAEQVADNDARARELQIDLDRWVPDRGRRLDAELRAIVNSAGNQLYAGSLRNRLEHAMEQTLEEYRNEASFKVREFERLARTEGAAHARRRGGREPSLRLADEARAVLATWRERRYPVPHTGEEPLRPNDPTAGDEEIAPLETRDGLSWSEAARRGTR